MTIGKSDQARKSILGRIRRAQGHGGKGPTDAERADVETYLREHPRGPVPHVEDDVVARFRTRAESMQTTTDRVDTLRAAPAAAARFLKASGLPLTGCVWPQLAHLDWRGAGFDLAAREAAGEDMVGITGAFAGIAETGTLMVVSGPDTPAGVSLLPETHIAIVPTWRIVKHMEDAWELARAELGQLPRAVNFISGPSRTGDIEQVIILGAHGPYRVHLILVDGRPD
ncbi:MAG: lactate utilization protein C [Betaproteobacteria bacterium]|jgi:L-lactate dehydrogenase complex protein LldG|nr:lactate utilization protein C [Betaproteobacteria bacterium]